MEIDSSGGLAMECRITVLSIMGIVATPIIVVGNMILGKISRADTKSTERPPGSGVAPTKERKGLKLAWRCE